MMQDLQQQHRLLQGIDANCRKKRQDQGSGSIKRRPPKRGLEHDPEAGSEPDASFDLLEAARAVLLDEAIRDFEGAPAISIG